MEIESILKTETVLNKMKLNTTSVFALCTIPVVKHKLQQTTTFSPLDKVKVIERKIPFWLCPVILQSYI